MQKAYMFMLNSWGSTVVPILSRSVRHILLGCNKSRSRDGTVEFEMFTGETKVHLDFFL